MRSGIVSAVLVTMAAVVAPLAALAPSSRLTVVLDFKGPWSPLAEREMQKESSRILSPAGLSLDWKLRGEAVSPLVASNLVVMTFHGSCQYDSQPPVYDELGPYAATRETDGQVQPFGDVDCTRVVSSARYAMSGTDFDRQDYLVGRALGRVVAHELIHMVTHSEDHAHEGVEKAALSGRELIGAPLPIEPLELAKVRLAIASSIQ